MGIWVPCDHWADPSARERRLRVQTSGRIWLPARPSGLDKASPAIPTSPILLQHLRYLHALKEELYLSLSLSLNPKPESSRSYSHTPFTAESLQTLNSEIQNLTSKNNFPQRLVLSRRLSTHDEWHSFLLRLSRPMSWSPHRLLTLGAAATMSVNLQKYVFFSWIPAAAVPCLKWRHGKKAQQKKNNKET